MSNALIVRIDVDDKGNPRIAKLGATAQKAKKDIAPLGDILKAVFASAAVLKGVSLLTQGIQNATKAQLEFNKAMTTIKGITGTSGVALDALSDKARELALNTEHSAANIAKAMLEVTKMGFNTPDTLKMMPAVLDMSTAAMTDLQWTATNTVNVMKAFGLGTDETTRVTNVMTSALNKTSLNLEDYMDAMKYVGPVAKSMGMSLEEASAMLGLLSDMSIKGTLGGTSLKNMLLNILKPGDGVKNALKDVSLEGKSLTEIMAILGEKGVSVADMLDTFDKRAVTSALAVSENSDAVKLLEKHFKELGVTAADAAKIIREEAIENQLKNISNIVNEIGMSFFDAFGDRPQSFLEGVANKLKDVDKWVDSNQEKISQFADVVFGAAKLVGGALELLIKNGHTLTSVLVGIYAADKLNKWADIFLKNLDSIANKAGTATGKLNTMGKVTLAGSALAIGLALLIEYVDKLNAKLDEANRKVSQDWFGEGHQKQIQDILDMQKKINNFKATAGGLNSISNNENKNKLKEMEVALRHMVKQYSKDWKDAGTELKDFEVRLKGIVAHNERLRDKTITFPELDVNQKTPGDLVNSAEDPEKAKAKADAMVKMRELFEGSKIAANPDTLFNNLFGIGGVVEKATEDGKKNFKKVMDYMDEYFNMLDKEYESMYNNSVSIFNSSMSVLSSFNDAALENTEQRLEAEKTALESRYNLEVALAGDSQFKKTILAEKHAQKQKQIEDKLAKEREKHAKREMMIRNAQATADMIAGVVNVMYRQPGELFTKIGAGLAYGAVAAGYIAQLAAINLREGTKGPFDGQGNSTSDSIPAMVSKGEWLLSKNDVDHLGGPQRIQQMLDRGNTYNTNSSMTVHVGTVIGTRQFVRDELIPTINKELSR